MTIHVGILGYGNLGRGVQLALDKCDDMELYGVFTRRDPKILDINGASVFSASTLEEHAENVDVLIICGGSAKDLPKQTPEAVKNFNIVDSFDNHSKIPEHYEKVNKNALASNHTALISVGWDPGLFSLMRMMFSAILPDGGTHVFWGKGVSQGHSDAVRRVDGVQNAIQYTIPNEKALEQVRAGENPVLSASDKHTREVYVVAKEGADKDQIEKDIKTMPAYFNEYKTTIHFIDQDTFDRDHTEMPHGGFVLQSGVTGTENHHQLIEFSLDLDSNPEFTASVLVAYARAVARLAKEGNFGCKTIYDIPPAYISPLNREEMIKNLL